MRMHDRTLLVMLLAAALSFLPTAVFVRGQGQENLRLPEKGRAKDAPLPRYGVVWENKLTRSGMPEDEAGWKWLRAQGVISIVSFRQDNDVDYARLGFKDSLWMPINRNDPPTETEAEKFLTYVQDPARWPVHIHCAEGQSRTGMMTALVRYAIDGWALDKGLAEAKLYRKGKNLSAKQVEWLRRWTEGHQPGSHRSK